MAHSLEFKTSARKQIASLSKANADRILEAIDKLSAAPRPRGCKKLKGIDAYRIRVGDYRVVYEIHNDVLVVLVVRVAHRREVYKA
jgi:mRNA interferase RelE/StbE